MANYIGKEALTLVRVGPSLAYVHRGEPVPEGASAEELKRLEDEGYIVKGQVGDVIEDDSDSSEGSGDTGDSGSDEAPAKSASKADWEAYARSQGATDEDLKDATKDGLVAKYGA